MKLKKLLPAVALLVTTAITPVTALPYLRIITLLQSFLNQVPVYHSIRLFNSLRRMEYKLPGMARTSSLPCPAFRQAIYQI